VSVSLREMDGGLILAVRDNGVGFDPANPGKARSLGLAGMRERVQLVSGTLDVESAPGRGTRSSPGPLGRSLAMSHPPRPRCSSPTTTSGGRGAEEPAHPEFDLVGVVETGASWWRRRGGCGRT